MASIKLSSFSTRSTLRGSATASGEREVMAPCRSSYRFSRRDPRPAPNRSPPRHDPSWQLCCNEQSISQRALAKRSFMRDETRETATSDASGHNCHSTGTSDPHAKLTRPCETRHDPPRRRLGGCDGAPSCQPGRRGFTRACGTSSVNRPNARCSRRVDAALRRWGFGRRGSIRCSARLRGDILRAN